MDCHLEGVGVQRKRIERSVTAEQNCNRFLTGVRNDSKHDSTNDK